MRPMKIKRENCLTVKQLKAILSLFDDDLPIIITSWMDTTDYCGEPYIFTRDNISIREINHGIENEVDFKHICIDPKGY